MKRFDKKGMLVIPNPKKKEPICQNENLLIVDECFCQNGHSLINDHAVFNGFFGIVFLVKRNNQRGMIAMSPVYGCKSRVALDVDLIEGDVWQFHCPECDVALPYYTRCECAANLTTFFTSKGADFSHSFGVCNRVGCEHAHIHSGDELLTQTMLEAY